MQPLDQWTGTGIRKFLAKSVLPQLQDQPFFSARPPVFVRRSSKAAVYRWGSEAVPVALKVPHPHGPPNQTNAGEYETLSKIWANPQQATLTPVIRPLLLHQPSQVLVSQWYDHPLLDDHILKGHPNAFLAIKDAHQWLSHYHVQGKAEPAVFSKNDIANWATDMHARAEALPEGTNARMQLLLTSLKSLALRLDKTTFTKQTLHGDATSRNFLVNDTKVIALDMAGSRLDDPLADHVPMLLTVLLNASEAIRSSQTSVKNTLQVSTNAFASNRPKIEVDRIRLRILVEAIKLCEQRHLNRLKRQAPGFDFSNDALLSFAEICADEHTAACWFGRRER